MARFGFDDELPSIAGAGALMEGGHWGANDDTILGDSELFGSLNNFFIQSADVFDGSGFGFVCDGKFEQKTVGREFTLLSFLN